MTHTDHTPHRRPADRRAATAIAMLSGLLAAACATPGIDYTARVAAGSPEAAQFRNVAVDDFYGPEGSWYAGNFEQMVAAATFDGAQWFAVSAAPYGRPDAVYGGTTDVDWIDEYHERRVSQKCVEWDGLFDCERRADVVEHCVTYAVTVTARPQLVDLAAGRIVWSASYSGDAEATRCEDIGEVGSDAEQRGGGYGYNHGDRRRHGRNDRLYGDYVIDGLVRDALAETLPAIRSDIAPYNTRAKARLITEAIDPEVRADPRFGFAVDAARNDNPVSACEIFADLARDYPQAPAIVFNMGACAEAAGDFETAQLLYAQVSQMPIELPDTVRDALRTISQRRTEENIIRQLDGTDGALPVPGT